MNLVLLSQEEGNDFITTLTITFKYLGSENPQTENREN